jgi:hypothetical protein
MRLLIALIVAVFLAGFAALHGINDDQALSYEAGLRQLQGQVPYEDFFLPHGPIAGMLFIPFLVIAQTGGWAQVLATIALNVAATLLLWHLVLMLTNDEEYAFIAALLTAVWYLPVMGGYYHDHLGFLFVLAGFYAYIALRSEWRYVLLALCFALAFYTKQTTALAGILAFAAAYILSNGIKKVWSKDVLKIALYSLLSHGIILAFIALFLNLDNFITYSFIIPSQFAGQEKQFSLLLTSLLFPLKILPWQLLDLANIRAALGRILFYPAVLIIYAAYAALAGSRKRHKTQLFFGLAFLVLATLWVSALLGRSMTELWLALGAVLALTMFLLKAKRPLRYGITALFVLLGLLFILVNSRASIPADRSDLYPIRIVNSDYFGAANASDVIAAAQYIQQHPGSVASLDDPAMLVPLWLRLAPQDPSLYYHDGLAVPKDPALRKQWEQQMIAALEEHRTMYVVTTLGMSNREFRTFGASIWPTIPTLHSYIENEYELAFQSGNVQVYRRTE